MKKYPGLSQVFISPQLLSAHSRFFAVYNLSTKTDLVREFSTPTSFPRKVLNGKILSEANTVTDLNGNTNSEVLVDVRPMMIDGALLFNVEMVVSLLLENGAIQNEHFQSLMYCQ